MVTVLEAASKLLSVCDGARTLDGQGFNKLDAFFVRDVVRRMDETGRALSVKQEQALHRTLKKYTAQLSKMGIEYDSIILSPKIVQGLTWDETIIPDRVQMAKEAGLEGKTGSKAFKDLAPDELQAIQKLGKIKMQTLHSVIDKKSTAMVLDYKLMNEKFENFILYSRFDFLQAAKAIPTAYWHPELKAWSYHNKPEVAEALAPYLSKGIIKPTEQAASELAKLSQILSARSTVQAIKNDGVNLAPTLSMPIRIQPFAHQLKAFQIGITLGQAALLMEQRTGKTLAAIGVAGYRYSKGQIKRLLVICPKTVSSVWIDEFKNANFSYTAVDLTQKKEDERTEILHQMKSDRLKVAVINHESAWRCQSIINKWKPNMVIVDESQKIKNGKAKQSKFLHKLGDDVTYKLILSGTPISQGPLDTWSQYRFLNSTIFGKSYTKFRDRYAIMGGYGGYEVTGYQNLNELTTKAHSIAFRVTLDECWDMKEPVDQTLWVDLDTEERKIYNQMEKNFIVEFGTKQALAPIVLTQLLRLQQITGGFLPDSGGEIHNIGKVKLNVLRDFVEDLPKHKKVVIFCRFIPELKAIEQTMTDIKRKSVTLYGATKNREEVRKQFRDDPQTTVFIAQIQTGGLGIDLASADTVIFFSTNFSYTDFDQAKKRVLGPNQKHAVTYIHILARDTVDEDVLSALSEKREMAHFILDRTRARLEKNISLTPFTNHLGSDIIVSGDTKLNKKEGESQMAAKTSKATETVQETDTEEKLTKKLSNLKAEADKKAPGKKVEEEPEVKKTKKETTQKTEKVTKETSDNVVTLKELLAGTDIDPKAARRILRKELTREEGQRWAWEKDSEELDTVKEALGLTKKATAKKGGKKAAEPEPEDEPEEKPAKKVSKKSKK